MTNPCPLLFQILNGQCFHQYNNPNMRPSRIIATNIVAIKAPLELLSMTSSNSHLYPYLPSGHLANKLQ